MSHLARILCIIALFLSTSASAANLRLAIQPMLDDSCTPARYDALADYLSQKTGHKVHIIEEDNIHIFRRNLRDNHYDLVLTSPNMIGPQSTSSQQNILAITSSQRSFQLITREGSGIRTVSDLYGHTVAGQASPSMASLSFDEFFPNIITQPNYQSITSISEGVKLLNQGLVAAIIMPKPQADCIEHSKILQTSVQYHAPVLTAAADLSEITQNTLTQALLDIGGFHTGLRALDHARFSNFEAFNGKHHHMLAEATPQH